MSPPPLPSTVHAALTEILSEADVLTDADLRAGYERDWTGRYHGECSAVVRPRSTEQAAGVMAVCAAHGIQVIPQGGNTGLVGGSVPRPDAAGPVVVISTRGLATMGEVDRAAMQVTLGAGVTLAQWRAHARAAGVDAPVDFAARDSATIGGAIATNAGGSRVVRYGTMRAQVAGIEAVTLAGQRVGSLAGLPKETVGIHLPSVLAGSEGTLALITQARLRVVPRFAHEATALVAVESLADAVAMLGHARRSLAALDSIELILPDAVDLVASHLGRRVPVAAGGAYVVIECADHEDPSEDLLHMLADLEGVVDSAVALDGPSREQIMALRDRITEAINAAGIPYKLDVAVPVAHLADLMDVAASAARADGARLIPFGHLAEGNLHLNFLDVRDPHMIASRVLPEVAAVGGTISAEHGVGLAKTPWLGLVRSEAELSVMNAMRAAWDPQGLLNPGVLRPAGPPPTHVP